jgi:hypothetical protein
VTEPTPDNPPMDPNEPDPTPVDPAPLEEEPPAEEQPPGEEQPAVPSSTPCTAVWPGDPAITCEIEFDNHAVFRLTHTRHANGTVYDWE